MKTFRVRFWCALCLLAFVGCNRHSSAQVDPNKPIEIGVPIAQQDPAPPGEGPGNATGDFAKVAPNIRPAVVLITVFDPAGKRITTGTGFFVSDDGKIVTSRHVTDGSVNAVAKAADGAIYNISGLLSEAANADLVILQADVSRPVPFLVLSKNAAEAGTRTVLIGSPLAPGQGTLVEETIYEKKTDAAGDWLDVTPPIPKQFSGWPLVDAHGEVAGIVSLPDGKSETGMVRPASAVDSLRAQAGATTTASWPTAAETPTPTPTPKPKVKGRLVYNPPPFYPSEAKRSRTPMRGSGRYRVTFDMGGAAKSVEVVQSAGFEILDSAAVTKLREWKAAPGSEWSVTVPISFQP
jgi:TonB family protein